MNKLLKTTGIFILGIGLLTGCTDKVAKKVDTNDNITTEVKTTEENPASLANLQKEVEHVAQIDNNIQTNIVVQYVINKKGRLVGARIFNKEDKDLSCFDKAVLEALEKVQNWTPGEYHHKKVNVIKIPDAIIGLHWEFKYHLIDLGITISSYCNNVIFKFIKHCKDFLRAVVLWQIVSGTVI